MLYISYSEMFLLDGKEKLFNSFCSGSNSKFVPSESICSETHRLCFVSDGFYFSRYFEERKLPIPFWEAEFKIKV